MDLNAARSVKAAGGNEESASTSNLSNKDASGGSAKQSPLKLDSKNSAPPVPAFQQPENAIYRYKPIFKLPQYYIKYMEPVYEGFEDFSFNEMNYEITQKDIRFLESSKEQGQLTMFTH